MIILRNFKNIFAISELRNKILFTLGVLVVYRIGVYIPVIGVDSNMLKEFMQQSSRLGGLLSYLDVFAGSALSTCTLFALGIYPYITASIMMQVLGFTVPTIEKMMKEESGRRIINQYTRYLALGLSIIYSIGYATLLETNNLVIDSSWMFRIIFVISLAVGCMSIMWLADQISFFGIGEGSSMIIFASIVSRFPDYILKTIHAAQTGQIDPIIAVLIWLIFAAITVCVVFLEKGDRKIPVQYARRVVGNKVYGGQSSYIPFKINNAGVMPAIFSSTLLGMIVSLFGFCGEYVSFFRNITDKLSYTGFLYNVLQLILIVFFYFFYTALVYNPSELAENIKKGGGFIPGIRPGRKTSEFFDQVLTRLGLVGAIYLGLLSILPNVLGALITMPFYLGGTSLLIVVGVALESSAQIESYLIEHNYAGFLSTGRLKTRGAR